MPKLSYKISGVDIDQGNKFVEAIKPLIRSTFTNHYNSDIGSFSGLFPIPKGYKEPYLVSATDGVGTKLKIAIMMNRLDTIGIDLVAMNVNDLITCGARPLFFLDYIATSRIIPGKTTEIVKGIAKGCKQSGCVLIGGETAEMPDLYSKDEFDIAGFVVGIVDKHKIIDGSKIIEGDCIIGLKSNGLHANGYSLIRNIIFKKLKYKTEDKPKPLRTSLGNELLKPTKIYVDIINHITNNFDIKGIAHITGGGLVDNVPRVLPDKYKAIINTSSWNQLPIFRFIEDTGLIDKHEYLRTFNCGIGMVLIAGQNISKKLIKSLIAMNETPYIIGEIRARGKNENKVEFIN